MQPGPAPSFGGTPSSEQSGRFSGAGATTGRATSAQTAGTVGTAQAPAKSHVRCGARANLSVVVRTAFVFALVLAACSGVEPLEPVGTTDGSPSSGETSSSSDQGSGADTTASSTSGADATDEAATAAPATTAADETGGSEGPCPVGSEGCACTPEDACDPGLSCLSGFCVDTGRRCPLGAEGCPCTTGGACDPGLQCASMICVDPG